MKKIHYNLLQGFNSDNSPILLPVELGYSEPNLAIAEKEAYNGKYTIEDDGLPEPAAKATVWDKLDAAYQEGVDSV